MSLLALTDTLPYLTINKFNINILFYISFLPNAFVHNHQKIKRVVMKILIIILYLKKMFSSWRILVIEMKTLYLFELWLVLLDYYIEKTCPRHFKIFLTYVTSHSFFKTFANLVLRRCRELPFIIWSNNNTSTSRDIIYVWIEITLA